MKKTLNRRNVQYPYCKKAKSWVIEDNGRIIAYICTQSCGSVSDPTHYLDYRHGIICYSAKRRNLCYLVRLDSEDVLKNLKRAEQLDKAGVSFYNDTYMTGSKKFDVN